MQDAVLTTRGGQRRRRRFERFKILGASGEHGNRPQETQEANHNRERDVGKKSQKTVNIK